MTREESVKLYNTYARKLYNISFRILHDSGEAEEIMQDTILKYITSDLKPLTEVQTAAWLSKTCLRKSIDVLRKKKREQLFLEEYETEAAWPDGSTVGLYGSSVQDHSAIPDGLTLEKIRNAISELTGNSRLILDLILLEGLDYEEVAHYTGTREGTIRVQYSRARARLADILRSM